MTKQYITWNRFMKERNIFQDPDDSIKILWDFITFTSLPYGEVTINDHKDMRRIAIIEYPDEIKEETLNKFFNNYSNFCFVELTPQEVIELLNEWYPNEEPYFSLDEDNFTIIDNKPIEDM